MSNKPNIADRSILHLAGFTIDKNEEASISRFAERIGEQMGLIVSDLISATMYLILSKRESVTTQSPLSTSLSPTPVGRLFSAAEIASFLNISKAKAYRMMQEGEILAVRMGRTVRVREQDLTLFVKDHVIQAR
jgi:excisionase family DNA binding protein